MEYDPHLKRPRRTSPRWQPAVARRGRHAQKQAILLLSDKGYVHRAGGLHCTSKSNAFLESGGTLGGTAAGCPSPQWPVNNPVGNGASGR